MRLICIASDVPLPANNGGRVDVWRRLQALRAAGHEPALLCWYDARREGPPSEAVMAQLRSVCSDVMLVPITRSLPEIAGRLARLWRLPSHAAARWVTLDRSAALVWAQRQQADAVLLDGLWGGAAAGWLAERLGLPMLFRSHNIEHQYMRDQYLREQRPLRRAGLYANLLGLERFERATLRRAARVFDISGEDCAYWQAQGFGHAVWMPTCVDAGFTSRLAEDGANTDIDILYFGNLNTPNNVEAVRWLVTEVLPLMADTRIAITLAGSRPSDEVRALVAQDGRLRLIENPDDMAAVVARAAVIVNPMRAGSGVNLKSVEMLFSDATLVSTSVGVKGLPDDAKACFHVADDAVLFAHHLLEALRTGKRADPGRAAVREHFTLAAVARAFAAPLAGVAA